MRFSGAKSHLPESASYEAWGQWISGLTHRRQMVTMVSKQSGDSGGTAANLVAQGTDFGASSWTRLNDAPSSSCRNAVLCTAKCGNYWIPRCRDRDPGGPLNPQAHGIPTAVANLRTLTGARTYERQNQMSGHS
jgi:hypothetical protein